MSIALRIPPPIACGGRDGAEAAAAASGELAQAVAEIAAAIAGTLGTLRLPGTEPLDCEVIRRTEAGVGVRFLGDRAALEAILQQVLSMAGLSRAA